MVETDVISLYKAVIQRLSESTVLKGDKVYDEGSVLPNAPMPYAVLATVGSGRDGADRYQQPGHRTNMQIRWWHTSKYKAMLAFQEGCRLLDSVRLTLADHVWERGRLEYITDFAEPDPEIGGHVVVSTYHCRTSVAAP